ncbi:vegetative cell wall protein gp1-like [Penaeus monodon]|uniref:vegetative cell wall protein gp1-like n=1 Tax=Penaeus monodon TaxID=6687 RepID=UPI0018A770FC|nr:vegetative cell wall protein gp1-like [Penaeus monodon]
MWLPLGGVSPCRVFQGAQTQRTNGGDHSQPGNIEIVEDPAQGESAAPAKARPRARLEHQAKFDLSAPTVPLPPLRSPAPLRSPLSPLRSPCPSGPPDPPQPVSLAPLSGSHCPSQVPPDPLAVPLPPSQVPAHSQVPLPLSGPPDPSRVPLPPSARSP